MTAGHLLIPLRRCPRALSVARPRHEPTAFTRSLPTLSALPIASAANRVGLLVRPIRPSSSHLPERSASPKIGLGDETAGPRVQGAQARRPVSGTGEMMGSGEPWVRGERSPTRAGGVGAGRRLAAPDTPRRPGARQVAGRRDAATQRLTPSPSEIFPCPSLTDPPERTDPTGGAREDLSVSVVRKYYVKVRMARSCVVAPASARCRRQFTLPRGRPRRGTRRRRSPRAGPDAVGSVVIAALAVPSSMYVEVPGLRTRRKARSVGFVPRVAVLRAQTVSVAVPLSGRPGSRSSCRS